MQKTDAGIALAGSSQALMELLVECNDPITDQMFNTCKHFVEERPGFKLVNDTKHVTVYKDRNKGSRLRMFLNDRKAIPYKADHVHKVTSTPAFLNKVQAEIHDVAKFGPTKGSCQETDHLYYAFKMPTGISNRDFMVMQKKRRTQTPRGTVYETIIRSCQHPERPEAFNKKNIRAFLFTYVKLMTSPKGEGWSTEKMLICSDVKGDLPSGLVQKMAVKVADQGVKNTVKVLKEAMPGLLREEAAAAAAMLAAPPEPREPSTSIEQRRAEEQGRAEAAAAEAVVLAEAAAVAAEAAANAAAAAVAMEKGGQGGSGHGQKMDQRRPPPSPRERKEALRAPEEAEQAEMVEQQRQLKLMQEAEDRLRRSMRHKPSSAAVPRTTPPTAFGLFARNAGALAESEQVLGKTLRTRQLEIGDDHEETLNVMNNLGGTMYAQKRFEEAEALWRRVLHTRRAQFGDMDARTAASMYNLATALREVKQSDEALRLFKEELEVCTSLSGP